MDSWCNGVALGTEGMGLDESLVIEELSYEAHTIDKCDGNLLVSVC